MGGGGPSSENPHLLISLPEEKRTRRVGLIKGFLKEGRIPHIFLDKLMGSFCPRRLS